MSRLNWSNLVNTAITGTGKIPRVNLDSESCVGTHHFYRDKYPRNASTLAMAEHSPSERST